MIKLFQFPSYWDMPNVSPFCMKLETYLRMAGLPYQIIKCADPRKAPKGKLPYIEDEGRVIADTGFIISYLKQQYGDVLDARLSPLQKAQALILQRMFEEHLYWCIVYSRWLDPVNWPLVKRTFFSRLPFLTRDLIAGMVRRHTRSELHMHGMGRHTQEEIYQSGCDDLAAISALLGEQPFMTGAEPASIDAVAYAFIANILYVPTISPMLDYIKSQKNLVNYCERMKQRFYS
jgi:glutathione S-transferase